MTARNDIFDQFRDKNGEAYYCPIYAVLDSQVVSERELDNWVDVATAERYSGNISIKDRNMG